MSITDIDNMNIGQFLGHITQIQYLYPTVKRTKITGSNINDIAGKGK